MEKRKKVTGAQKERAVTDYLEGKYTMRQIGEQYKVHHSNISKWVLLYQTWGREGLERPKKNRSYPEEFKEEVVRAYQTKNYSLFELCRKYKLRNFSTIQTWVAKAKM